MSSQPAPLLTLDVDQAAGALLEELEARGAGAGKLTIDPERVEQDLARLVLALMEFLRQVLELQAIRRMEAGRLTEDEEERVGATLMRARAKIIELADQFGLSEQDLQLRLGPLGRLV